MTSASNMRTLTGTLRAGDEPDEALAWGREMLRNFHPDHVYNPNPGWRYVSIVASDVTALLHRTRRVIFLENGDVAVVRPQGVRVVDGGGRTVARTAEVLDWDAGRVEKVQAHEGGLLVDGRVEGDTTDAAGEPIYEARSSIGSPPGRELGSDPWMLPGAPSPSSDCWRCCSYA